MMGSRMLALLRRLNPFKTPDARRLALLFGVVYFAQGMWYLPNQTITIVLKERGLSAGQVADFFFISTIPWLIKPVYGLLSDFVPLFGRRRQSYLWVTSALAAAAGFALRRGVQPTFSWLAGPFTLLAGGPVHRHGAGPGLHRRPRRRADGREWQAARAHRRLPVRAVGGHPGRLGAGRRDRRLPRRAPRAVRVVHPRRELSAPVLRDDA